MSHQPLYNTHPVKITSGSDESDRVNIGRETIIGFVFPPNFEGSTIRFKAATEESTTAAYYPVVDAVNGTNITVAATQNVHVPIHPSDLASLQYIKVISDTAVTADRIITIITRPIA